MGKFKVPDKETEKAAYEEDKAKEAKIESFRDSIQFQTDYVNELASLTKVKFYKDFLHNQILKNLEHIYSIIYHRKLKN